MSLTEHLFQRFSGRGRLNLALLQAHLAARAAQYVGCDIDRELVRARLADGCRDAGLQPLTVEAFDAQTAALDAEAWRRFLLAVSTLELKAVRDVLPPLAAERGLENVIRQAFVDLAQEMALLTLELLRQAPLRLEELARQFLARLGVGIQGETAQAARQRLERLDYGRLLAEAERAKQAAEGRMEQLDQLQDKKDKRRSRRGKW